MPDRKPAAVAAWHDALAALELAEPSAHQPQPRALGILAQLARFALPLWHRSMNEKAGSPVVALSLHTGRTTPLIHCGCAGAAVVFLFWHCPSPNVLSLHHPHPNSAFASKHASLFVCVEHGSAFVMSRSSPSHQSDGVPPGRCGHHCDHHSVVAQPVLLAGPYTLPVRQLRSPGRTEEQRTRREERGVDQTRTPSKQADATNRGTSASDPHRAIRIAVPSLSSFSPGHHPQVMFAGALVQSVQKREE
jgi:hypothetical protein